MNFEANVSGFRALEKLSFFGFQNIIPTNKPNVEPKRPSRPVNITPYCQSQRDCLRNSHRLTVEWTADKRAWVVGIFIVNRLNSKILL